MKIVLLVISFGFLLPSIVTGQQDTSAMHMEQEEATIYFYRRAEFYNGRFECWVDDLRLVSNFKAASYFWLNLPAGTYEIRTNGRPTWLIYEKKYQLKVEAGQVYYIEAVIEYDFLGTALFLQERNQADFNANKSKLNFDASAIRLLE